MTSSCVSNFLEKKIIIIGAGIAGLVAAAELSKKKFTQVILLEATDRVGGRVKTIDYGSNIIELGAQWIHGEDGNIIYEMAKANNLVNYDAPVYSKSMVESSINFSEEDSKVIIDTIKYLSSTLHTTTDSSDLGETTLTECLQKIYEDIISDADNDHIKDLKQAAYNWYLNLQCELNGCKSCDLVSVKLLNNYTEFNGNGSVELKNGYKDIVQFFLNQIPPHWIHYEKVVKLIDWSNTNCVKISCEDESSFIADHVIITLPLGYLKQKLNVLFQPSLPPKKCLAIRCTGFEAVNKIYLEFNSPFWSAGDIFKVLWTTNLKQSLKINQDFNDFNPWYKDINRFAYVLNQPNLLCAWVTGNGACVMENLADQQILDDCFVLLTKLLSDENLPKPFNLVKTNWHSEPFSCGSYSYLSTLNYLHDCDNVDLAQPISNSPESKNYPLLLFAGEACHPNLFSTVHGAAETGIREAKRIISYYEQTL